MKYIFRGLVILNYDPKTKSVTCPEQEPHGNNFNFCNFIPEDYANISEFFEMAYLHSKGLIEADKLKDYDVS